ncbi:hypothetical protein [Jatrophihabitans endophyticus]|uniref:hypothetical protein n=1 Tax=Jatrophihabitans endophyticus TaxID=1206085 RepID=UPI0019F8135F|nr:hypothetical protein [Jatrophihabitans endophyticus]MBE7188362.1 hypothetical protein [Jatrophihabitans endophyticus]
MPIVTIANRRTRAAMTTVFALAAALAVCVVMLFWTPLEAPASWRAAAQTAQAAPKSITTAERL